MLPDYIKHLPPDKKSIELESLVQTLFESSLAGYWDWKINEDYEYLSPAFKQMFGYQDHEMKNHPSSWQSIIFEEDAELIMDAFKNHVDSKGNIPFNGEVRYHHKNGHTVWVYCRGKVIEWNEDGSPKRAVGVHIDISALKELQNHELYIKKIETANKDLEQLVYICSHDLREPLQSIKGMIGILREEIPNSTKYNKYFEFIEEGTNRLEKLLQGLIIHSKLGIDSKRTRFDLNQVIVGIQKDLNAQILASKAILEWHNLPVMFGNEVDYRTLFTNLISNSIKFRNQDQAPHVLIECFEDEDSYRFFISDNGIGISPKQEEKIFQMFQRLHSQEEFNGLGIGLALVKKIISLEEGYIRLSEPRLDGTSFEIYIPKITQ